MERQKLPEVTFERGYRVDGRTYRCDSGVREAVCVVLLGTLKDMGVFYLSLGPVNHWESPVHLGLPLRRKILAAAKALLAAPPAWFEIRHMSEFDGEDALVTFIQRFHREVWRGEYLGDREEDYVVLAVPYAEKDEAKALGARWDPELKRWKVRREQLSEAFTRWLAP